MTSNPGRDVQAQIFAFVAIVGKKAYLKAQGWATTPRELRPEPRPSLLFHHGENGEETAESGKGRGDEHNSGGSSFLDLPIIRKEPEQAENSEAGQKAQGLPPEA